MDKYTRKKLIITIFFVLLLCFVFYITNIYDRNKKAESITMVKSIVDNDYDKIIYEENNNYLIGYYYKDNVYNYDVYDLNGNNLYSFSDENLLNIVYANKKYYIVKNDEYYLYNKKKELLLSADYIKGINNDLILVDNMIINLDKEIILENIKDIDSFKTVNNDYYYAVDNYLIDEDGDIVYDNVEVCDEINEFFITNYVIIKKDGKYYTFFPNLNTTVGSGFDYYYKDNYDVYIYIGYDKYKVYYTGIRNKVSSIDNIDEITNNYNLEVGNIINDEYAFVTNKKDNSFGILNLNSLEYEKVSDKVVEYKKIDDSRVYLKKDKDYIYDLDKGKYIYDSNYDLSEIIYFDNDYKVVKDNEKYLLLNDKNEVVNSSSNQIFMNKEKVKYGIINEDISMKINDKLVNAKSVDINDEKYIYYNIGGTYNLYNIKTTKEFKSDSYISYSDSIISLVDNNKLTVKVMDSNKEYTYDLKDNSIVNKLFMNSFIIEEDNGFKVINKKGKNIKKIDDTSISRIIYNDVNRNIVIITEKDGKEGSYLCK